MPRRVSSELKAAAKPFELHFAQKEIKYEGLDVYQGEDWDEVAHIPPRIQPHQLRLRGGWDPEEFVLEFKGNVIARTRSQRLELVELFEAMLKL